MVPNDADYPGGMPSKDVRLAALGFDATGHRGGGITTPVPKKLPVGAVLLRLYMPSAPGKPPGDFGTWWFTPHEYKRICAYFGVDGTVLVQGRSAGKSALHGVLALLHEWYGGDATQLSYLNAVMLKKPLWACYGPGAPANAGGYARTLKPVRLSGGTSARQIYIHQCWLYQSGMQRLLPPNASTDKVLGAASGLPMAIKTAKRLDFETA